jgi:hypothetical protein
MGKRVRFQARATQFDCCPLSWAAWGVVIEWGMGFARMLLKLGECRTLFWSFRQA